MTRHHRYRERGSGIDDRSFVPTLVAGLAVVVVLLVWFGRDQWFFGTEWNLLVDRDVQQLDSVLSPLGGHWISSAVVFYQLSFRLWGLESYLPYQIAVVLAHVGVIALVWVLMRRLGVRGWIATGAVFGLALFGTAAPNLVYAFQITVTGSVLCGLAHLLLADHDGPLDGRDWVGVAIGFVGLTSSAIGPAFVVGVGVTMLARRRWLAAAAHTVPLGLVYGAWYASYGRDEPIEAASGRDAVTMVADAGRDAVVGLGQNPVVAALLGALALVGLVTAVLAARSERDLTALAIPGGLLAVAAALVVVATRAQIDAFGAGFSAGSRYVYVVAVLVLPLIALGGERLARVRTPLGAVPLLLLALGLPGNVDALGSPNPLLQGTPDLVAAVAGSRLITQAPGDLRPTAPAFAPTFGPTLGWLRSEAAGRLPDASGINPRERLRADALIALQQGHDPDGPAQCEQKGNAVLGVLEKGDVIRFTGRIRVVVGDSENQSRPLAFDSQAGSRIDVVAGPLTVLIAGPEDEPPRIC